mgnify:CR=1 FL=1
MKYLYLILSSLKRKKLRTGLTILSIMVAFVLFGYLSAIRQAFDAGIEVAGVDRLIVRHKVSIIQLLPQSYEAKIENIEGVDNAMHQTWFGGYYQRPTNFFAQIPVNPDELYDMYPEALVSDSVVVRVQDASETYKSLVKDLHPDMNGGNRADEERLQEVVWAWDQIKDSRNFQA